MPVKLTRLVIQVFYVGSRLLHLSDASWSRRLRWLHLRYRLHLWHRFRLWTQNSGGTKFSLMSSSQLRHKKPTLAFGVAGKHLFAFPEKLNLIVHHKRVLTRKFLKSQRISGNHVTGSLERSRSASTFGRETTPPVAQITYSRSLNNKN